MKDRITHLVRPPPHDPARRRQPAGDTLRPFRQVRLVERDTQRLGRDARRGRVGLALEPGVREGFLAGFFLDPLLPVLVLASAPIVFFRSRGRNR